MTTASHTSSSHRSAHANLKSKIPYSRRLLLERLEDRSLLTAGMLDPTFGIGGKVITDFFIESNDFVAAVAIQTDGRIVVAGTTMGTSDGFAIARYNPDGTLDGSFGTNGRFHIDLNSSFSDQASAIAIQSDGKIVVAGGAVNPAPGGNADFAVVRLNGNGSLDTSFDGDGTKLIDIRDSEDGAGDLIVQPDGKIVIAGTSMFSHPQPFDADFAVVRLNGDGTLDTSFDTDGKLSIDIGPDQGVARCVALQPDGKLIVAGETAIGPDTRLAAIRLNTNGTVDTSFGLGGFSFVDFDDAQDLGLSVAVQSDGKVVVSGITRNFISEDGGYVFVSGNFAIVRLNADGNVDTSFDLDGKQTIDFGSSALGDWSTEGAWDMVLQSDGDIVMAGASNQGATGTDFSLARLNSDGSLDLSFDSDGKQTIDFGNPDENARGLAVQADGRIVVAGFSRGAGADLDFALARLFGSTVFDADVDGIDDSVDTLPLTFSNDFSDLANDGATTGTITSRGDQLLTIVDAPDPADGVLITADLSGGAEPATISIDGGASSLSLTAGDQVIATHGSVILDVLAGLVEVSFVADSGGVATASLTSGTSLTFQPETFTFIAAATNTEPVQIIANGEELSVPPGETVVAGVQAVTIDIQPESLNVDSNGTLTVVVFGAADFDAAQIDVGTVRFAGAAAWHSNLVDKNGDGRLDLQLKFRRQDTILDQIYADLLLDDLDADGILDSTRQTAQIDVTGQTLHDALFSGAGSVNLFLAGRSLRNLLDDLFG